MPSNLRFWTDATSATPHFFALWTGGQPTNAYQHAMAFPMTDFSGIADQQAALMWKLACHFIIDRLPHSALKESAESLSDIAHFYVGRETNDLPRLPSTPVMGRIVSTQVRPPFELSEE